MSIAERAAIEVENRDDSGCRRHALYQMTLVVRLLFCLGGTENRSVQ